MWLQPSINKLGYGFRNAIATGYNRSYAHRVFVNFFKKYSLDVRVCLGGLQCSNHVCFRRPLFLSSLSLFIILSFSVGDISSSRGLYTVGSLRWSIALAMYSLLSSTTIVEPLSALFITSYVRVFDQVSEYNSLFSGQVILFVLFMFVSIQHLRSNSVQECVQGIV